MMPALPSPALLFPEWRAVIRPCSQPTLLILQIDFDLRVFY